MAALSEVIARFGFQLDDSKLKQADKGVAGLFQRLQGLGALFAGSLIVRGVSSFIDNMTTAGDELAKTSKQMGFSAERLYAWRNAAELSGAEAAHFDVGIRRFTKAAYDADRGLKTAQVAFKNLGVDIHDSNGEIKDQEALLKETGLALGAIEQDTKRTALAQELFGRSGTKLLPLFLDGAKSLESALSATAKFGSDLRPFLKLSEDTRDRLKEWEIASYGVKATLLAELLPAVNLAIGKAAIWAKWLADLIQGTNALQAAVVILGFVLASKISIRSLLTLGRAVLLPLAKFILLYLVVDDLLSLLKGGESVIGKALDRIFGKGTAGGVAKKFDELGDALNEVAETGDWKAVNDWLDSVFGPPGQAIVEGLIGGFKNLEKGINDWGNEVSADWDQFWEGLANSAVAWLQGIEKSISDWGNEVSADFQQAFDDLIDRAKSIGDDVVNGLITGLTGGASKLNAAAGDVAANIEKAIRGKLKSNSDSKVMIDVGKDIDGGLITGMLSDKGRVADTFNSIVPAPTARSYAASVQQVNHNNITVPGSGQPNQVAHRTGAVLRRSNRNLLEEAAASLLPIKR